MAGKRKQQEPTITSELLNAVRFVGLLCKDKGAVNDQFCMANNGFLMAFNGTLAIGAPIVQQIVAAPHNKRLADALAGCTLDLQITQMDAERLHVRSGDFQAFVPCCPADQLSGLVQPVPDAPLSAVDDTFKAGIIRAGAVANPKAPNALCQAVTLNSGSCIATNNTCIIETWHGFSMRDAIHIPKSAVVVLGKIKKQLISFGYSDTSCTFYFADRSWFKTMLYTETLFDLRTLLNIASMQNAITPPAGLFDVVGKLAKFAYDGKVYCGNNRITAWENASKDIAAEGSYEVPGAPSNLAFLAADLLEIADIAKTIDFRALANAAAFFGTNCRGAVVWEDMIAKIEVPLPSESWKPAATSTTCFECGLLWPNNAIACPHCGRTMPITDDDIPF